MTMTGEQVKAARGLLGWTQDTLAGETGVSRTTIAHFGTGKSQPSALNVSMIRREPSRPEAIRRLLRKALKAGRPDPGERRAL
jgi:DNA-binding XRE family transcriptional regulator